MLYHLFDFYCLSFAAHLAASEGHALCLKLVVATSKNINNVLKARNDMVRTKYPLKSISHFFVYLSKNILVSIVCLHLLAKKLLLVENVLFFLFFRVKNQSIVQSSPIKKNAWII